MVSIYKKILDSNDSELLRHSLVTDSRRKPTGKYYRFCKRCGEVFPTPFKTSKVCDDCTLANTRPKRLDIFSYTEK